MISGKAATPTTRELVQPKGTGLYPCPNCEADVEVPLPLAKHVDCKGCGAKLEIHPMTEQEQDENGDWQLHDRTELSVVPEQPPMVCKRCGALTPPISPNSHERGTLCADCEQFKTEEHMKVMLEHCKKQ